MRKRLSVLLTLVGLVGLGALPAGAHTERPAYWPDPAVDSSVPGGTGGAVPKVRSLASALDRKRRGRTRVVCMRNSLKALNRSIARARKSGYEIRPTDRRSLSAKQARRLKRLNKRLFKLCRYREIQPAVTASGNNDRVVIMPGLYTEPTARSQPTHDPACDKYRTNGDKPGEENTALSYAYQFHCPNDQNLIAVMGREPGAQDPPRPPLENRHGIPDLGACIRCNVQIEGSGVNADDVAIDAGDPTKGDGGPNGVGTKKDVAIRADRADGFVLKNVKVRHAKEHGIYVLESDGYVLTHFKAYYNGLYGTLTFAEDHGLQQHCDGAGHGDSAIYPGAAVESGHQRPEGTEFRYNQEVRFCDMRHNMAGYSGTNGNAVWVHDNNIYDNVLGLQTDVVTGAGHPGYPGDSMLVEKNNIYSNNFNIYAEDSEVKPAFPFPMGTGLWIAGGNRHVVRNNHIYDNWRRGTMLFTVPDQLVCGESAGGNQQAGCDPNAPVPSTSHYNQQHGNFMGLRPDGTADPNGTDFWWDPYPGTVGNCWFDNTPAPGAKITYSPASHAPFPECDGGRDPGSSIGTGNPTQTGELGSCVLAFETRNFDPDGPCPWFKQPPEPQPAGGAGTTARGTSSTAFDPPFTRRVPVYEQGHVNKRADLSGVSCAEWNTAGDDGRDWLVKVIREFAGGPVNGPTTVLGSGTTLPDETAHALFDAWCPNHYAEGFLLYKLYTYAAVATLTKN